MADFGALPGANPYSPSAVARTRATADDPVVTVATPAVHHMLALLRSYLDPRADERGDALAGTAGGPTRVVAVVGEYGTGKTHLAMYLLRQAHQEHRGAQDDPAGIRVHLAYLEAPSNGFDGLYRSLARDISSNRQTLRGVLRDRYAKVVADSLGGSELARGTVEQLRERRIDPDEVVERLGLIDSLLAEQFHRELDGLTRERSFAIALSLLLRHPELEDDVWHWLTGGQPSQELIDRDIAHPIAGTRLTLEAMGVIAYLFGGYRHRFVLVIDELDNILTGSRQRLPDPEILSGFRKLFEVFDAAGAMLVVVGLPDLFDLLSGGTKQRVIGTVRMTPLDAAQVRALMELTHRHAFGRERLEPFEPDTPGLIAQLTGGLARQVIRLCYRSYQDSLVTDRGAIDAHRVLRVARQDTGPVDPEDVRDQVHQALHRLGLTVQRDVGPIGAAVFPPPDFWITVDGSDAGCAVFVTPSLVSQESAEEPVSRARAVRDGAAGSATLLVVAGLLRMDRELVDYLTRGFDSDPIVAGRHDSDLRLQRAVTTALQRIHRSGQEEDVQLRILRRTDWMARQLGYSQDTVERLSRRVDQLGAALAADLNELRHQPRWRGPAPAADSPLPPPVASVFHHALAALTGIDPIGPALRWALASTITEPEAIDRQRELRTRLTVEAVLAALGAVRLRLGLVETFRDQVEAWYREAAAGDDRAGLSRLCQGYDAIYYDLSATRIDGLADAAVPGAGPGPVDELGRQLAWTAQRKELHRTLESLGSEVQLAAGRDWTEGSVG